VKALCRKLSNSMPDRIRKCLKNKGQYIPYWNTSIANGIE
jgi:hypothetical protein